MKLLSTKAIMRVTRARLKELVQAEFGSNLERISPAGAREFLDRLYRECHLATYGGGPIEIREEARSFEQIMAEFFTQALTIDAEDAAVMLWLHAFEQHFANLEEEYTERFIALFGSTDSTEDDDE